MQLENLQQEEVGYLAASMLGERSIPSGCIANPVQRNGWAALVCCRGCEDAGEC